MRLRKSHTVCENKKRERFLLAKRETPEMHYALGGGATTS
jgi:hypothetical protein